MTKFSQKSLDAIRRAVERGREKLRAENERIETERRERQEENEKKWLECYRQAQSYLPEEVCEFLSRDDQAFAPSHFSHVAWKVEIFGFSPIFVEFGLNNRPEYFVAELDEIVDGTMVWRQIGTRANFALDLDIALAMAFERYLEAHRRLEEYKRPMPQEPEYVPVDDEPVIINPPLFNELADFIRGIVDERLDERNPF